MANLLWFFILGLLPSLIWLVFYYKKDVRPEPKKMILIFFLYGIIISLPVAFIENAIDITIGSNWIYSLFKTFLYFFFVVALIEEGFKFLIFRFGITNNLEFDEPTDSMIYIISVALGFAATENILILFPSTMQLMLKDAIIIIAYRFVTATILHALASANIGFFFALSLYRTHRKRAYLFGGFFISVFLHALYNFATSLQETLGIITIFLIITGLFILTLWEFSYIKKFKSVCKI